MHFSPCIMDDTEVRAAKTGVSDSKCPQSSKNITSSLEKLHLSSAEADVGPASARAPHERSDLKVSAPVRTFGGSAAMSKDDDVKRTSRRGDPSRTATKRRHSGSSCSGGPDDDGLPDVIRRISALRTDGGANKLRRTMDRVEEDDFMQEFGSELIFLLTTQCAVTEPPPRFLPYIC